jgi:hypothetical protein
MLFWIMEVVITATTGKDNSSSIEDAIRTFKEAMKIAKKVGGRIVYGRGFDCGTEIVLEK